MRPVVSITEALQRADMRDVGEFCYDCLEVCSKTQMVQENHTNLQLTHQRWESVQVTNDIRRFDPARRLQHNTFALTPFSYKSGNIKCFGPIKRLPDAKLKQTRNC